MKWKHKVPNKYDYLKNRTLGFLENEKLNTELEHEKNIGKISRELYVTDVKKKYEVSRNYKVVKAHTGHFIQNEKVNTELEHEKNVGKINSDIYLLGRQRVEDTMAKSRVQENRNIPNESDTRKHTEHTYEAASRTKQGTITMSKTETDYTGTAPKRYTTKCYIKLVTVPAYYRESLTMDLRSKERIYNEKVFFKNKTIPFKWSETMKTETNTVQQLHVSNVKVPVEKSKEHYISLEPQQNAATTDL